MYSPVVMRYRISTGMVIYGVTDKRPRGSISKFGHFVVRECFI